MLQIINICLGRETKKLKKIKTAVKSDSLSCLAVDWKKNVQQDKGHMRKMTNMLTVIPHFIAFVSRRIKKNCWTVECVHQN